MRKFCTSRNAFIMLLLCFISFSIELTAKIVLVSTETVQNSISPDSLLRGPEMTDVVVKTIGSEEVKIFYLKPTDYKLGEKRTAVR